MIKFTNKAKKYGPWSSSKLDVANNCALRFYWKFIDRRKEAKIEDSRGRIGIAVHQALELVTKGQDLKRALRKSAIDSKLTTLEADDLLMYRPNIEAFVERIGKYKERNPVREQLIEFKFGLDEKLNPTDFWNNDGIFRGVFDFGLDLEANAVVVIDHKTGEESETLEKYIGQLDTYAVAATRLKPHIDGVQTAVHYVKTGKIDWNSFTSTDTITKQTVPWLVEKINAGADKVTESSPEPTTGWWCSFCGYKTNCPEWMNK